MRFTRRPDRIKVVHPRHEQATAYMALGAALATARPQAYAVVPGPGLLNTGAALLTAYAMNAPVLGLIGQIPDADIGRGLGQLHEIRDQAGIISRLVDFSARIREPQDASALVAKAIAAMASRRRGPAVLECAIDVWGRSGPAPLQAPLPPQEPAIDEDAIAAAATALGAAKRPLIICGGGAQGAGPEVTALAHMLQAPVQGYRRGRGVLDSRDPLSVTLPLGRELWAEADVVLAVGTRLLIQHRQWGIDDEVAVIRVDSDPEEPARLHEPAVALIGDAAPILRRLIDALATRNAKHPSRRAEMQERQARWDEKLGKLAPQRAFLDAIRAELPEDGIFVDEVTQMGFVARLTFRSTAAHVPVAGLPDNLGWGFATAPAASMRGPTCPSRHHGDGGFMSTANELAMPRHRIPLVMVVFADGIRKRPPHSGRALRQPPDRLRPQS